MKSRMRSLSSFKYRLNVDKPVPRKLYFFGDRKMQVIHARLRNRCSSLNEHLYLKHLVESALCRCGYVESTRHYFLECLFYRDFRQSLSHSISYTSTFNLQTILFGDESLSF